DRPAVLAVPDDVVFLVMLDEQAGGGDVVTVDDDAGVRGVDIPADAVAVIGPPGPDVVEEDAVAVDLEADRGPAHVRAAYAEEHVLERGGLRRPGAAQVAGEVRVVADGVAAADAEQGRRGDLPGADNRAGNIDAADMGDRQWDGAVLGRQGGHPQPQDDRVRAADRDGPVNGVHAGGEKEVPAQGELAVDGGHRVGGPG